MGRLSYGARLDGREGMGVEREVSAVLAAYAFLGFTLSSMKRMVASFLMARCDEMRRDEAYTDGLMRNTPWPIGRGYRRTCIVYSTYEPLSVS